MEATWSQLFVKQNAGLALRCLRLSSDGGGSKLTCMGWGPSFPAFMPWAQANGIPGQIAKEESCFDIRHPVDFEGF